MSDKMNKIYNIFMWIVLITVVFISVLMARLKTFADMISQLRP